jgi:hypothetical protein
VRAVHGGDEDEAAERRERTGGVEAEAEVQLVADGHPADVRLVKRHEHWLIAALGD